MTKTERELLIELAKYKIGDITKELAAAGLRPNEGRGSAHIRHLQELIKKIEQEEDQSTKTQEDAE